MTFDTAIFIVCILVINAFIFAAMRSLRICAIIFGALLAVPYFLLGYVYDGLPRYPQPHRIIGFCNYVPRIMNNTDLCPGSGLHPDGSYVTQYYRAFPQDAIENQNYSKLTMPVLVVFDSYYLAPGGNVW